MRTTSMLPLLLPLVLALPARAAEELKLAGKVVDDAGKPVAGVEVGVAWRAEGDRMTADPVAKTGDDGSFSLAVPVRRVPDAVPVLALTTEGDRGAAAVVERAAYGGGTTLTLVPTVRLTGRMTIKELGTPVTTASAHLVLGPLAIAQCRTRTGSFGFRVPPGAYRLALGADDAEDVERDVTVAAGKDLDLGEIDLPPTLVARSYGKAAPAFTVTDARGISKDGVLEALRGKWVLVEFWGHW